MKKMSRTIYKAILDGYSLQDIQNIYSIPTKEFSFFLKDIRDNGYRFQREILANGQIYLTPDLSLNLNPHHRTRIVVADNVFHTMFISDTHIGNIHERLDYIRIAYEYARTHNIHVVISAGDLIDNVYEDAGATLRIPSVDGQIHRLTSVFPNIQDIITLCLYGNHEAHSLTTHGRDVAKVIEDRRFDMINLGYGGCTINMKNDSIGVSHYVKKIPIKENIKGVSINFRGNSHKSKTSYKEEKEVYIPTLSDNVSSSYEYKPLPGFLAADIIFDGAYIERVNTTQLSIVNDELRMSAEDAIVLRKVPHDKRVKQNIDKQ